MNWRTQWTNPWLLAIGAAILFFVVNTLLFGTEVYLRFLDPGSAAGQLHMIVKSIKDTKDINGSVAVLGDSRVVEGFSEKIANERTSSGGVKFVNVGVPGTVPRIWYYMLRDIDPHANRFSAVALMLPNYDECDPENVNDRVLDLNYLGPELRYSDMTTLPASFDDPEARRRAYVYIFFRGSAFKSDVLEFLSNPHKRLKESSNWRKYVRKLIHNYSGRKESLQGLVPDPTQPGGLRFPADIRPDLKPLLEANLAKLKNNKRNEGLARYRELWFGRIVDRYRNSATRLIIFQIPRGPLDYLRASSPPSGFLADMAREHGISVLPADSFASLEHPEFFFDHLHMNAQGRERFSKEFADRVQALLQNPAQATP